MCPLAWRAGDNWVGDESSGFLACWFGRLWGCINTGFGGQEMGWLRLRFEVG